MTVGNEEKCNKKLAEVKQDYRSQKMKDGYTPYFLLYKDESHYPDNKKLLYGDSGAIDRSTIDVDSAL